MLQTHVNNGIYHKYCLKHNIFPGSKGASGSLTLTAFKKNNAGLRDEMLQEVTNEDVRRKIQDELLSW